MDLNVHPLLLGNQFCYWPPVGYTCHSSLQLGNKMPMSDFRLCSSHAMVHTDNTIPSAVRDLCYNMRSLITYLNICIKIILILIVIFLLVSIMFSHITCLIYVSELRFLSKKVLKKFFIVMFVIDNYYQNISKVQTTTYKLV